MAGLPQITSEEQAIAFEKRAKENRQEEALQAIEQALGPPLPMSVERMLSMYNEQWVTTAHACLNRAVELEDAALQLRERADRLNNARSYLDDVKETVQFEIDSRNAAARLALVNPSS